ncbi:hypothetical protein EX30DRAFT_360583 [Ascodesmis nigricans]|uniref:WD40 repeat-like protein n=1 Tax=Ascodesmis nigricans TaxID=341454 RepID=A0A4S2N5N3_9PEZI|nr:hypothetical protein EX30DRAFT_360583 [Ascodesmis nigricans]
MPVFADHYRNARLNRDQPASTVPTTSVAVHNTPSSLGGNFNRPSRIYPREINNRHIKSPNPSTAASPLISAIPNASFARSIPLPSFLSNSSPSSGAPGSLGSASGGVGLGGVAASPPSGPGSYSSGGGFGPSRRGYQAFDGQHSAPNSAGFQNSYGATSPASAGRFNNGGHVQPGENNFACELQTIDDPSVTGYGRTKPGGTGGGDNVVCLGWDGGVDVWRIDREKADSIGQLTGLNGQVMGAKILPNPPLNDPLVTLRPLICLTIHSPMMDANEQEAAIRMDGDSPYSDSPPERPETAGSDGGFQQANPDLCSWQTTVEVWSLASKSRMATLFASPPIPLADVGFGISAPPPVWGGLRVQVSGGRVVVGLGNSGELYIFELTADKKSKVPEWKCVDKLWTCVQYPNSSFSGEGGGDVRNGTFGLPVVGVPVFALSDRWLAYCPAPANSFTADGEVRVPILSPTVTAQVSPPQPPISASVEGDDEPLMDRVKRGVTQGALNVGKRAADAGYKMIQNYLNREQTSSPNPPQYQIPSAGNGYVLSNGSMTSLHSGMGPPSALGQQIRQMQHNGNNQQMQPTFVPQNSREDRLISIVDLQKLSTGNGASLMGTFCPSGGVSFLSLSPSGLALLSASSKGDVVSVWDLLKSIHQPSSQSRAGSAPSSPDLGNSPTERNARLIARFQRLTVATIVDVDWAPPRGEKIAVVTERGTAHFYDLPSGAYQWPPYKPPPPSSSAANSSQTSAAGVAVSNAVNLFNSSTQPLLTAARRHSRGTSLGGSPGALFALPSPSNIRKINQSGSPNGDTPVGSNRISLPPSTVGVQPGCVKFLVARERGYVAVVGGGKLQIYQLRPGGSGKRGSKTGGVAPKGVEYQLPYLPDGSGLSLQDGKAEGFWSVRSRNKDGLDDMGGGEYWKTPLAWAEIETNTVCTPWHQLPRVKMFHYTAEKHQMVNLIEYTPAPEISPQSPGIDSPPQGGASLIGLDTEISAPALVQAPVIPPTPEPPSQPTPPMRGKKGKKSKGQRGNTPMPAAMPVPASPAPTPAPILQTIAAELASPVPTPSKSTPVPPPSTAKPSKATISTIKPIPWVFGKKIEIERVYISDAGGRGDVEFLAGKKERALREAMRDGLRLDGVDDMDEGPIVEEGIWGVEGIEDEVGDYGVVVGK